MVKSISHDNGDSWDLLVKRIPNYDIYYLNGYQTAFRLHGDGLPILLVYESNGILGVCVYMLRDVSLLPWVTSIKKNCVYDAVTPYGYGGWLFNRQLSEQETQSFFQEYVEYMKYHHIICAFTRWHALLQNQDVLRGFSNVIDLGQTIDINTETEGGVMQNMLSKDRNTVRKAIKNGVTVKHSADKQLFNDFIRIYNQTMDKDRADSYYYFKQEFYEAIARELHGHWQMYYALYDGKIIAMSIILYCNKMMHYHLSGSILEYRNLNATNLLLYQAAVDGSILGYKRFHLGGGVGSVEDSLYRFKKSFNKFSGNQYSISKDVFDEQIYKELVDQRIESDPSFNPTSNFFPVYRI